MDDRCDARLPMDDLCDAGLSMVNHLDDGLPMDDLCDVRFYRLSVDSALNFKKNIDKTS
ncbi:hypothetical protein [Gracilinema caldarium]|uniref:Uncharacterized protein n=1 Tax=Gracilinema caldarium (strain ATCC 51460 / DSM 7334 / H1) TaxID=744872 RepID=F8EZ28_GRAC1|nr:hypothetical protein [Gracilinema caldarium]AEJ19259.1 hypothetical protein Spica_1113 [Gracilinema caldarium DSM 7334]